MKRPALYLILGALFFVATFAFTPKDTKTPAEKPSTQETSHPTPSAHTPSAQLVRENGYIQDRTGTLSPSDIAQLSHISNAIDTQSGIQIATVIVPSLGDDTIEGLATTLFEQLKIGQKGKDNGVLLLIALSDKQIRIEVGYGLEGTLPDGKSGAIIRQTILPHFQAGHISEGIIAGHTAIAQTLATEYQLTLPTSTPPLTQPTPPAPLGILPLILIALFSIGFIASPTFRRVVLALFLANALSGGRSHRGGGHFGGGGFGGFGGGSSGGGGASGRW